MIRLAICDDNAFQRAVLKEMLEEYRQSSAFDFEMRLFGSGEALLQSVQTDGAYDVYLLDMIMPGINGMETAITLRQMRDGGKIIFLTATHEYAAASYEVDAFYYLLKPVDPDKMKKILGRAFAENGDGGRITVKTKAGTERVKPEDILYVSLADRAPCYHLKGGRTLRGLTLRVPFREALAPLLSRQDFEAVGLSLAVNLAAVDRADEESLLLRDGTLLYPSRSACSAFLRTAALR